MDLRREAGHALRHRLAVGKHEVAAGQDLVVVLVHLVVFGGADRMPAPVVVNHVSDDQIRGQPVDQVG